MLVLYVLYCMIVDMYHTYVLVGVWACGRTNVYYIFQNVLDYVDNLKTFN